MSTLADQLEPRKPRNHASVRLHVTASLAFRCLCGIAQAPRFWLGFVAGAYAGAALAVIL